MIKVYEVLESAPLPAELTLCLPFDERKKSRLRTRSQCGEELGLMLPRGQVLRNGTLLRDESGRVICVEAAAETLSVVLSDDPLLLMRAAYHLGNRHVPLQVEPDHLRYQHDHVLDDMVRGLGLSVEVKAWPFEPEDGAYHSSGSHEHSHEH